MNPASSRETRSLPDHYGVLQVDPAAAPEIVEAAYRELVRRYDVSPNPGPLTAARLQAIRTAYEILRDPDSRRAYDESRRKLGREPRLAVEHRAAAAAVDLGPAIRARLDLLALAGVVLLALVVRLVSLTSVPPSVTADEADNLQVVYRILEGRGAPGLFGLDWKPAPAFSVYLMAGFMQVFGWSIVGMRMASVVLTSLSIIPFYFAARERLSVAASLVSAFLLSTGLWYLHFSRSGWENAQVGLFTMLAVWTLNLGLRGRGLRYYALAGVASALGLYGYFSGRAIILSLLAFLPFALWQQRTQARQVLAGYAALLLVCAVVFAPQVPAIVLNWDHFNSRVRTVSIASAQLPYLGARTLQEVVLGQVSRTVSAFLLLDGGVINNSRYYPVGRPILDPLAGLLFLVGLVAGLGAFRRLALWWCLLLVPLGMTQVFSMGTPDLARAVGAAPVLYLFVGYGFDRLAPNPGSRRRVLQLAVLALLPWAAYHNLTGYAEWMARPETISARQPAVEAAEFDVWQQQQAKEAAAGRWGFTAGQWQEVRKQLGLPSPRAGPPSVAPRSQPPPPPASSGPAVPDMASFVAAFGPGDLFQEPRGVAVDSAGNVYVTDPARRKVLKLDAEGKLVLSWGREGRGDGEFLLPWDVAVDGAGRVYVLDSDAQVVQRFDADGNFQARLLAAASLYRPRGLAVDAAGNVYVADTGGNRVVKASPTGEVIAAFSQGTTGAAIEQPTDVAVDDAGNVFVAEPAASRLQKLSPDGRPVAAWQSSPADTLNSPHLAIAGRWLLASDPHLQRVDVYSLEGALVGFWGGPGDDDGRFDVPMGVAADPAGNVYVADVRHARVQRFRLKE